MTIKELEKKVRLFDMFAAKKCEKYSKIESEAFDVLWDELYSLFCDSKFVGLDHWEDCAVAVLPILKANAGNRRQSGVGLDPWLLFKSLVRISETEKLVYDKEYKDER